VLLIAVRERGSDNYRVLERDSPAGDWESRESIWITGL
jgi:hypothetical protein